MSKLKIDKNQLVEQFGMKISRLARRMIQNNDLASDAAQEVWYELVKSINSFRGDSDISTWIYTIAKRTILKYAKSERIYCAYELNNHFDLEPIEYKGLEEDKEQWVKEKCDYCLTAFCHCLNNESRLIFLFHDIVGLQYSQISQILEMKEDNLRQIASRSKEKVRNFMDKNCVLYNPNGDCKCRIRKHIISVDLDKAYDNLAKAANLVDLFQKFDKELPRKNYWEKFVS
jgi:RNA polymerase sigma factor (sigma-70 family)